MVQANVTKRIAMTLHSPIVPFRVDKRAHFRYISMFALCFEGIEGNKIMPRQTTFAKQGEIEPVMATCQC